MNNTKPIVLVVDDEEAARYGMTRALAKLDYQVLEAASVDEARERSRSTPPDLLLLDINLPGTSGLEYLEELRRRGDDAPLIVIVTAHGSERTAVEAIKLGAYDYLSKPFDVDDLRLITKNALETIRLRRENSQLREQLSSESASGSKLIGTSRAIDRLRTIIAKVSETDATVLIHGESGTGKELVARAIHEQSAHRRSGAFVAVNCAALPSELIESELFGHEKGAFTGAHTRRQGKFEQAHGGTLFLDEIGDMSIGVQAKLLRALEERRIERLGGSESLPVDVRVVSATHRNLENEIAANTFRADLFYRLRVVTIEVSPLREHKEDIPLLARNFADAAALRFNSPAKTFTPSFLRELITYDFPGNIRELRNIIERAVVLADDTQLTSDDLPDEVFTRKELRDNDVLTNPEIVNQLSENRRPSQNVLQTDLLIPYTADFREDRREFERRYITRCLEETDGNVTRAATLLGIHRQSLQHKLRELGLSRRYVTVDAADSDGPLAVE